MRIWTSLLLSVSLAAASAAQALTRLDPINLRSPAINQNGLTVFFAAAIRPDAQTDSATNLHRWIRQPAAAAIQRLTNFISDAPYAGLTSIAYPGTGDLVAYTALPEGVGGREEVRLFHLVNQTDRVLATDRDSCIQILCVDCFRACLRSVHLSPDGQTALYDAARNQPFYSVKTDQSGSQRLGVYQGAFAPSPQNVIAQNGTVVFTSSAPFGPTLTAAADDVYLMNLDGANIRNVTNLGNPMLHAAEAVISRDGARIAFALNSQQRGFVGGEQQIWTVRPDGSDFRRLSTGDAAASSPSISADGAIVTYLQNGQVKRVSTLLDPAALTAPVTLTDLSQSSPAHAVLSGDGAQVTFTLGPSFGTPSAVYRAATAETGRNLRQLTPIYAPRLLFPNGVASAAGNAPASPGSLITVYGANLGMDELATAPGFPLPSQLKEISLLLNTQPIPIHSATPWQINAHLPQSVAPGRPGFSVRYDDGVFTAAINAEVKAVAPENFFVPASANGASYAQAAAFHAGTLTLADAAHPARAGEILEIYGLGLGVTNPVVPAGVASPVPPAVATQTPRLDIGGRPAAIAFAGLIPGLAGVYQVNAAVPSGLSAGLHNLRWTAPDGSTVTYSGIFVQ